MAEFATTLERRVGGAGSLGRKRTQSPHYLSERLGFINVKAEYRARRDRALLEPRDLTPTLNPSLLRRRKEGAGRLQGAPFIRP
jgi:hypothetical protein